MKKTVKYTFEQKNIAISGELRERHLLYCNRRLANKCWRDR